MTVRWRELLAHVSVPWVDRGHSVTRGWIAVKCPWCGTSDPSEHLGINEEHGYYHCLRSTGHSGRSPYFLLNALGVRRAEIDDLLEAYGGTPARRVEQAEPVPTTPYAKRWDTFKQAATDPAACAYLAARGFWNPVRTARTYDLRVGVGRYGGRLWFPYRYGTDIVGYTGRAMHGREPRYLTEAASSYLYLPRLPFRTDKAIVLVEGPIDALRLADATQERYALFVAALCGLSITPTKRRQLSSAARLIPRFFVVLDSSVQSPAVNNVLRELGAVVTGSGVLKDRVRRLELPPGIDDPGEMSGEDIERWLRQTGLAELVM